MKEKGIFFICLILLLLIVTTLYIYYSSAAASAKVYDRLRDEVIEEKNDKNKIQTPTPILKEPEIEKIVNHIEKIVSHVEEVESNSHANTSLDTISEQELQEAYQLEVCELANYIGYEPVLDVDYDRLKEINADYRGWLNIPGTNISYPVPQGKDNVYYLRNNFETQAYDYAGTLFIDAYSYKLENQDNLIIYGHNMKDGTMFGTLKRFNNYDFFQEHPYIEFYTEGESRLYLIFSVRLVKADITTLNYQLEIPDVQQYINHSVAESKLYRDINLLENGFECNPYTQIISLSTCVNNANNRLIVSAIRIK